MGIVTSFQDIQAWKKAHELVLKVYALLEKFPKYELFSLTSQIRRCAISVPSNIAEGFKRKTKNDAVHFYTIADGSLSELKYQLLLSRDLHYISEDDYHAITLLTDEAGKLLHGWIKVQK